MCRRGLSKGRGPHSRSLQGEKGAGAGQLWVVLEEQAGWPRGIPMSPSCYCVWVCFLNVDPFAGVSNSFVMRAGSPVHATL